VCSVSGNDPRQSGEGLTAQRIYQVIVADGAAVRYDSVWRYLRRLSGPVEYGLVAYGRHVRQSSAAAALAFGCACSYGVDPPRSRWAHIRS
jgi:hypothetical protein